MKKILVTGGAGFIGANFITYILNCDSDIEIVNLDLLTYAGNFANLEKVNSNPNYHFVHGDICDQELVFQIFHEHNIDTVVHFAAESHVDRSILDPGLFIRTNIVGTQNLLEQARIYWLEEQDRDFDNFRFHHISTDEVFGALHADDPPFSEKTPYDPRSPYSASKASSDHLVRAYYHTFGLPVTISNCTNNYGPYQFPEKLIPLMILNAINGKGLPIYGDGKQIRDWLYVEDHCEAIYKILKNGRIGETYAIGGDNQPTNIEIVSQICQILDNVQPQISHFDLLQYVPDRPGHDRRYDMNISKIHDELGWSPKYSLVDGITKTVHWYLDNQEWVDSIGQKKDYQQWIEKNYYNRNGTK